MMNPEQPNFFKMMLTESSPQEDTLSKLNKEKEAIEKDLEDKKITQDVYDKKMQEVQTRSQHNFSRLQLRSVRDLEREEIPEWCS
jgi:hypothetical protein